MTIFVNRKSKLRITNHPILTFNNNKTVKFTYDGHTLEGYEGETIASALHANGVKVLSHSHKRSRARGFYCAIGNCGQCNMIVDGVPNVRVCTEMLKDGMVVNTQHDKGQLYD